VTAAWFWHAAPRILSSHDFKEIDMTAKLIVASILVPGLISALTDYVVQNTPTPKCAVVTKKPSAKSKTTGHCWAVDAAVAQGPSPTWRSFLRNYLPDIAAIDMFVVATAMLRVAGAIRPS
jgi:hypothetical protein